MEIFFEKENNMINHEISVLNALEKILESPKISGINLVVSKKETLSGILEEILGKECIEILKKKNRITIEIRKKIIEVKLFTEKIQLEKNNFPILAPFITVDHLKKVIKAVGTGCIFYVPWLEEENMEAEKLK